MSVGLDTNRLGDAIKVAVQGVPVGPDEATYSTNLFRALAGAIVSEITTHAVVHVTSVAGVTTGTGVSGIGTGTIT
jgi:ribosome biogenesis protein Nip4